MFPDDEEGTKHPAASPISSIPNIDDAGTESAWRSAVLLVLTTSPDMVVWEVSERYTAWLSACHIKLGVAGTAPQAFFMNLIKEADAIYTLFKNGPRVTHFLFLMLDAREF